MKGTFIKQGKGKIKWRNGSIFEGWWKNDKPNFRGKLIYSGGDIYIGEYVDGKSDGLGKLFEANGGTKEG